MSQNKKPELPTETWAVIMVTEFNGQKPDSPIYACRYSDYWRACFGTVFPDGDFLAHPDEITGWKLTRYIV